MSDKQWCPGCDSITSKLTECFRNGWGCEYCGLSHEAWSEILLIRAARSDDELSQRVTELRIENDKLKREQKELHMKLNRLRDAIRNVT